MTFEVVGHQTRHFEKAHTAKYRPDPYSYDSQILPLYIVRSSLTSLWPVEEASPDCHPS